MSYKIGDRVVVDVHLPNHRREGRITGLPGHSKGYPTYYLVKFTSGSSTYLTAAEMEHVDVVTRLSDLANGLS